MMGVASLLGRRIFNDFAFGVGRIQAVSISEPLAVRLAFATLALKVFFNFLPMAKRLYPTERSLAIEDLLPISVHVRYKVFYFDQLFRDLPFFVAGMVILLFFGQTQLLVWPLFIWAFFPGIEIGFTLTWVHFWSANRKQLAGVFGAVMILLVVLPVAQFSWWADFFTILFVPLGYYQGFKVWRYRDMGRFEQFLMVHQDRNNKIGAASVLAQLSHIIPKNIRPLVLRDLILTARNFVPQIWRNVLLVGLVVLSVVNRGNIDVAAYCALAVFMMASTVAPLFSLQRPYRAMDNALPISAEQVWCAKLNYARLISFPIPFIFWGIELFLRPRPISEALVLLLTLVLLGIAVSSLVGGSICEGDQRPVLQYIIAAFMSVLATLFIVVFNPAMFLLLFPVLSSLKGSAITRLENEGVS